MAVGSHDTASAVVAAPLGDEPAAYISSGTWSLVGLGADQPVLTDAARAADFTNEGGVDGTIRFLKNVMLWVLSGAAVLGPSRGARHGPGHPAAGGRGRGAAAERRGHQRPSAAGAGDPDDDLPSRVAALAREAGELVPATPVEITRCILDSLAVAYRRHVRPAGTLADGLSRSCTWWAAAPATSCPS